MKKLKNKSGFTLIEIIVVLIIIGILVAIAVPNLFSNVPRANGSAALATVDAYKTEMESCYGQNGNTTGGASPCNMQGLALTTLLSNGFTLTETGSGSSTGANLSYSIYGNDGSYNAFTLTRTTTGGYTCTPNFTQAAYSSVCS